MKKKTKKPFPFMDERNRLIAFKIMSIMYILTILAMQGIVIYRQFWLNQPIEEFEDIAIIMTVNTLFLFSAFLYYGVIPVSKMKVRLILVTYLAFVILGSLFTYAKYNLFLKMGLSLHQLFEKLIIIISITGLIMGFFMLFTFLGNRKIEKELE
jgi:hypothetical protein